MAGGGEYSSSTVIYSSWLCPLRHPCPSSSSLASEEDIETYFFSLVAEKLVSHLKKMGGSQKSFFSLKPLSSFFSAGWQYFGNIALSTT